MRRGTSFMQVGFALVAAAVLLAGCAGGGGKSAAEKVYVKPGEYDTHYAFLSGGHSGQVFVYGLPSCRHITTIPVFTPESARGYGFDEESKAMLGGFTWGDAQGLDAIARHPRLPHCLSGGLRAPHTRHRDPRRRDARRLSPAR
jgi:nitrous oxide reductase